MVANDCFGLQHVAPVVASHFTKLMRGDIYIYITEGGSPPNMYNNLTVDESLTVSGSFLQFAQRKVNQHILICDTTSKFYFSNI